MTTEHAGSDSLRLELEEDGIGQLVFDRPGSRVNFLSRATLEALDTLLGEAERLAGADRLRALVLRSAKPGVFLAGVDLEEMRGVDDPAVGAAQARSGQRVLRRLEQLPVPTVAAIDGACLGAGAELALACSYRLATLAPRTRIGFPEVHFGILPALGGTVRLPRLIGIRAALELILTGRSVDAPAALRLGVVDAAFPPEEFDGAVRRFMVERIRRGRVRTGARRGVARRLLEDTAPGRRVILARFGRELARAEGGRLAARRVLEAVADGVALPLERAFEREAEALGELIVTPEAKGLLHAFRLRQAARRARSPGLHPELPLEQAAVLGAGRTGTGIAYLLASHAVPVRLRETRHGALVDGLDRLRDLLREGQRTGRHPRRGEEDPAGVVTGTLGFGGFGTVAVAVEAVGEDPAAKRAALREVEEHVREGCVLVSTTGAVPIARLQEALERPGQLVGVHFVPPVAWGTLVEVARGPHTSGEALAAAHALVRRLGRISLAVGDGPGFLVNRVLIPYLNEALRLLEEGAPVERVDGAMVDFGMALGPLRQVDELGLGRVARVAGILAAELGERLAPPPLLRALTVLPGEQEFGFYRYEPGKEPRVSPRLGPAVKGGGRVRGEEVSPEEVRSRLVMAMVNEAAHALEDGIVAAPADVDLAMLLGVGFPAFRGGLLFHADALGIPAVVATLEEHARRFGERFAPALLLRRLAEQGAGLYGAFPAEEPLAEAALLDRDAAG